MAIEYTKEQLQAIETLDKSVLVSAAAGSGKTAILVERILRIILEGKANVDELLVVTFTRAAASEMKVRLAAAIRRRMREQPQDAARLRDQLSRLYRAYITTIDSFALRVIREFFYETDNEPDFRACDEVQGELMRREALTELFEEGFNNDRFLFAQYESGSEDESQCIHSREVCDAVNSVGFREFLRLYSEERSDETFKDRMLKAYAGLRSIPDYFEWAYERAEELRITKDIFAGSMLAGAIASDTAEVLDRACEAADRVRCILEDAGLEKMYTDKLSAEVSLMHELRDEVRQCIASGSYIRSDIGASGTDDAAMTGHVFDEELMDRINAISFGQLRAGKDQKESYEPIKGEVAALRKIYKDEINDWKSRYMIPDLEARLAEMNETYRYTVYFIRLLEDFERRYMEKKRERGVMDFSDMEHNAVRILRRKDAADTLRQRFNYIFVDEYQDTNRIQEELISSVARPDNVFRVGDIKQSIYKFRQAEPEIFRTVYDGFSDPANEDGVAIDLGRNFRSNDATIRYINHVFERIMEGYDDRAKLYTGIVNCPPEYDFTPEVHLLTTEGMKDADSEEDHLTDHSNETTGNADGFARAPGDIDEETDNLSKEEAEAEYIAGLVSDIIGTEFYDTKAKTVRKAEARDIVILFRAVRTRGEIMSAALRRRGIEPHIEESDDYFDTVEIGIAMSLLSCIDNMKRDVPLIATLHSEVFGWTPSELAEIRIAHTEHEREMREAERQERAELAEESAAMTEINAGDAVDDGNSEAVILKPGRRAAYWEALNWYRENGPAGELRDKADRCIAKLLEWRRLSHMMALDDFVWHVLVDSGYYRMAGAMHGGARRQANLRKLADRAGKYSQETVASLSSYISFVDVMRQKGIKSAQTPAAAGDEVVRITTIHKSKGLEYPFVIVGGLGHRFRYSTNDKGFSFDSSIGVGMPYIDLSRKYWRSTMLQRAINSKSRMDEFSEELRVLYVAMTRARNKLIMTGVYENEEKLHQYSARPECYLKVMRNVLKSSYNEYRIVPLESSYTQNRRKGLHIPDPSGITLTDEEKELYNDIDRKFSYEYPDSELLSIKAKYSVSELRRESLKNEDAATDTTGTGSMLDGAGAVVNNDANSARKTQLLSGKKRKNVSAADIGTGYHRIMEFLDFALAVDVTGIVNEVYIRERAGVLAENDAIAEDVYKEIELDRIFEFFGSDIGRRAADAERRGTLRKEKAFTLRTYMPAGSCTDTGSGHQILVQGVIDCCFEENGRMILIDYKSNFIRPGRFYDREIERIRREYKVQIDLYSEAILKGTDTEVGEAYLYLFSSGEALRML